MPPQLAQPVTTFRLFMTSAVFDVLVEGQQPTVAAGEFPALDANVQPITPPALVENRLAIDVAGLTPHSVFAGLAEPPRLAFTVRGREGHNMASFMRATCTFEFLSFWKNLRETGGIDERIFFTGFITEVVPQPVSPRAEVLTNVVATLTGRYLREESTDGGITWVRRTHIDVSPGVNTWYVHDGENAIDYYADYKASATGRRTQ